MVKTIYTILLRLMRAVNRPRCARGDYEVGVGRWCGQGSVAVGNGMIPGCLTCEAAALRDDGLTTVGGHRFRCRRCRRCGRTRTDRSGTPFARYRWPREVIVTIVTAVRWYGCYRLSLRDVGDLLAERGVDVSPRTVLSWGHPFGPLLGRCWQPNVVGRQGPSALGGTSPRPTSAWAAAGRIVTVRSTTLARSSTCCSGRSATWRVPVPSCSTPGDGAHRAQRRSSRTSTPPTARR